MKRIAALLLASGIVTMLLTFGTASLAVQGGSFHAFAPVDTTNTCLYCHADAHADWNLTTAGFQNELKTESPTFNTVRLDDNNTDQFCTTCHLAGNEVLLAIDDMQNRIDLIQQRVENLRTDLQAVHDQHPNWDRLVSHVEKPETQRTAERIATLIGFVEADGSWGWHDPSYTEQLLSEAEQLMADLLSVLEH